LLLNAARVYTYVETAAGIAGAMQNIITTGTVSIGDVIALIPALTWGLRAMSGMRATCFIMGTEVLVEDPKKPGLFSEKVIEDVHDGDKVWTRNENDPDGPLELKAVTKTYIRTAYDLQAMTVADGAGNSETYHVTDEHPFYVEGRGWIGAGTVAVGDHLRSEDGDDLIVTSNVDEPHPEGLTVFNFEVADDHSYFVADGVGEESFTWVHNADYLGFAGFTRLSRAEYALGRDAHRALFIERMSARIKADAAFAKSVEAIGGKKLVQSLRQGILSEDWVVHHLRRIHANGEAGWLGLIRAYDHRRYSGLLHPGGFGGFKEWCLGLLL
jgi:hypothetical protein